MKLVLFDIDGTLITDNGAAREAYRAGLADVYGYTGDLTRFDFSGRTDPQITFMVLRDFGLDDAAIERGLSRLWQIYLDTLQRYATADRVTTLAGIPELVDALAGRDDVVLGLLTGNMERGARIKLTPPHLNRYFPFGAFGSDSAEREQLPPIAIERASRRNGHRFSGRDVVIIGDSIYDIRCGAPHKATTIAIASGKTPAEKLRAEKPDHFFDDARDTQAVVKAIVS